MKKALFCIVALLLVLALPTAAAGEKVLLRVEGSTGTLYAEECLLPEGETTAQALLTAVDGAEDALELTGAADGYITAVNGEAAAAFGGWDGWLVRLNGGDAAVGIGELVLTDGDELVLYYGDPYGVGMQYPECDASLLGEGTLKFTSADTTYDAAYNATVTVNPVTGLTVSFDGTELTTDENGCVAVPEALLTPGAHAVSYEKYAGNGLPLVLRGSLEVTTEDGDVIAPPYTGDSGMTIWIILAVLSAAGIALLCIRSRCENK